MIILFMYVLELKNHLQKKRIAFILENIIMHENYICNAYLILSKKYIHLY